MTKVEKTSSFCIHLKKREECDNPACNPSRHNQHPRYEEWKSICPKCRSTHTTHHHQHDTRSAAEQEVILKCTDCGHAFTLKEAFEAELARDRKDAIAREMFECGFDSLTGTKREIVDRYAQQTLNANSLTEREEGLGGGKYDPECQRALDDTKAKVCVLLVLGGDRGNGFSVASVNPLVIAYLPGMLREMADSVDRTLSKPWRKEG